MSKTFTTAETMLNAKNCREEIIKYYRAQGSTGSEKDWVGAHLAAVSTNLTETTKFGIQDENVFGFWDWVGGRFSVCSAVGMLPLSLHYGFENMETFLAGARSMD